MGARVSSCAVLPLTCIQCSICNESSCIAPIQPSRSGQYWLPVMLKRMYKSEYYETDCIFLQFLNVDVIMITADLTVSNFTVFMQFIL